MKKTTIYLGCILFIIIGFIYSARFVFLCGNAPWLHPQLCIDGHSYIKGMSSIVESGDFLNLKDLYHSPGYQMYLAFIYSIFPNEDTIFLLVKIVSLFMRLLTAVLIFYLGEKYFETYTGAIAALLFAFSFKYHIYTNLLQYEVVVGFLILFYVFLLEESTTTEDTAAKSHLLFLAGVIASIVCLFHIKYLFLIPCGILCIMIDKNETSENKKHGPLRLKPEIPFITRSPAGIHHSFSFKIRSIFTAGLSRDFAVFLFPFLFFLLWSLYQSSVNHEFILVSRDSSRLFRIGNNLNAQGFVFPYPPIAEPSGLRFVMHYPTHFLWLVKERFLYLWDIKTDIWYLGHPCIDWLVSRYSNAEYFHFVFPLTGLFAFLLGVLFKLKDDIARPKFTPLWPFYTTFLASIIGPLLVFASSRFLIPVIPIIVLFQSYAIIRLGKMLKNRKSPIACR